jgi:hypothetical protein
VCRVCCRMASTHQHTHEMLFTVETIKTSGTFAKSQNKHPLAGDDVCALCEVECGCRLLARFVGRWVIRENIEKL